MFSYNSLHGVTPSLEKGVVKFQMIIMGGCKDGALMDGFPLMGGWLMNSESCIY